MYLFELTFAAPDPYRFTKISQIFQNVSGNQEVDVESPKCYLGEHAPDPSRSFHLWHLFQKSVTIYPRSAPVMGQTKVCFSFVC